VTATDRSFTINATAVAGVATLDASGTGAVNFTSSATPGFGTTAQTRTPLSRWHQYRRQHTRLRFLANNGSGSTSIRRVGTGQLGPHRCQHEPREQRPVNLGTLKVDASQGGSLAATPLSLGGGTFAFLGMLQARPLRRWARRH